MKSELLINSNKTGAKSNWHRANSNATEAKGANKKIPHEPQLNRNWQHPKHVLNSLKYNP